MGAGCLLCRCRLAIADHGICSRCNHQITRFCYCGCCGSELAFDMPHCGKCLTEPPQWQRLVAVSHFRPPLSELIHRFKFQRQFQLDRTLARLLLLAVRQARRTHQLPLPDVILPVPLHRFRHWQRGYNQSELLTKWLSRWLAIPYDKQLLQRTRHTTAQRALNRKQRRKNLKNAFNLRSKPSYHSVAIVDDVITTGATMTEICKLLQKCGVKHIQVWCLCRT
ncbi:competence protein ComF [Chelonobacter oris]|uniref:Competence protein ComF n=1 Tax=Chelonobacter oris TaxID=505317 RepID=A0A0A3B730_9PAST|nr:competence protein ComF [Chelonobacter oris]